MIRANSDKKKGFVDGKTKSEFLCGTSTMSKLCKTTKRNITEDTHSFDIGRVIRNTLTKDRIPQKSDRMEYQ